MVLIPLEKAVTTEFVPPQTEEKSRRMTSERMGVNLPCDHNRQRYVVPCVFIFASFEFRRRVAFYDFVLLAMAIRAVHAILLPSTSSMDGQITSHSYPHKLQIKP